MSPADVPIHLIISDILTGTRLLHPRIPLGGEETTGLEPAQHSGARAGQGGDEPFPLVPAGCSLPTHVTPVPFSAQNAAFPETSANSRARRLTDTFGGRSPNLQLPDGPSRHLPAPSLSAARGIRRTCQTLLRTSTWCRCGSCLALPGDRACEADDDR